MSYPGADNETNEVTGSSSAAQFDIKKFIFKLISFLPWIIISTLISYSIATLYLRYTAQVHKITAQILIKDDRQSSNDDLIRDLGVMPGGKEVQDQIDILQSYQLAKEVVDSLHLQFDFIAEGRIASSPLYGNKNPAFIHVADRDSADYKPATYKCQFYADSFYIIGTGKKTYYKYGDTIDLDNHKIYLVKNNDIKQNIKGYNLIIKDTRSIATAIKTSIDVRKPHDMGGAVEISTSDEIPERAVDIINTLVRAFEVASLDDKKKGAENSNRFLNDRVTDVETDLDSLETKASSFKKENKIDDASDVENQYLTQVQVSDKAKEEQEEQIKLLDAFTSYIKSAKNTFDIVPSTNGIADLSLSKLVAEYDAAVIDYNTQSKISTDKDMQLSRRRNELNELKNSILLNISHIRQGLETLLIEATNKYDNFNNLLAALPEKERILVKLKRQISVKEQLYLFLLQKKYDAELSIASVVADSRVVDSAHDQGVIKPQASQIKMFAILLGVFLPILIMLSVDFFDNRIADRREVETNTRVPVIGELSYTKNQKTAIISPQSRNVLAEQFRLIRTNLQYFISEEKAKLILVTSFMSGEGKSFVSLNLSSSLTTGNKRVLLIEMDLRKPKLAKYLNITPAYGLTDYLVSETATLESVVTNIPGIPNADVITSGPIPPNPTELIMSEKVAALFEIAKTKYDYIVVDSSPVGLVADAFMLGAKVDITLFILRHKYSYKTTVKFVEKLYTDQKFNRLSIIINGIVASSGLGYGYGYGYGYSYGYGYHYGSGYYVEDKNKTAKGFMGRLFKK